MRVRKVFSPRPFQKKFLKSTLSPGIRKAALSMPRGNGKSTLGAWLAFESVRPGGLLYRPGAHNHVLAESTGQARRTVFGILTELIRKSGKGDRFRIANSQQFCHVIEKSTGTKVSVLPASGRACQGIVSADWIIADEPGSWKPTDGELVWNAISKAVGKPDSLLRLLLIGTLAPAAPGTWWPELVARGSVGSTHVTVLQGDPNRWDNWHVIRKANPLMATFAESRKILLEERDEARADPRLKASFLSYRLNYPSADSSTVLLTVQDWKRVLARPVAPRVGQPVVGIDLGGSRAWSAACAVWTSGRTECVALTPGIPDLAAQEKRDSVPPGTYQRLVDSGALIVSEGRRVADVNILSDYIRETWNPVSNVCDRFRVLDLADTGTPTP